MVDERERERVIHPIVPQSVQHNARVVSRTRSLTASLFGVAAGILGLESAYGFVFYFLGTALVGALILGLSSSPSSPSSSANGKAEHFFESRWSGVWMKDVFGGLSSFVLTWTLFYGLIRS